MLESGVFTLENPSQLHLKERPALAGLPDLAVIRAEGADTLSFLDRIFTNRVSAIGEGAMISGWADAKGRLLAAPRIVRAGEDALHLVVPRETAPDFLKKLRLYVFRSKVRLEDVTERLPAAGLLGSEAGAARALEAAGLALPAAAWGVSRTEGACAVRMPDARGDVPLFSGAPARVLLLADKAAFGRIAAQGGDEPALWWLSEIAARTPSVFSGACGKFVPQGIGLGELGGLSFNKGCYPGQEVIARVQHNLSKFRKALKLLRTEAALPAAGEDWEDGVVVQAVRMGSETFALMQAPAA